MSDDVWDDAKIREAFIYDGGESDYYDPINGAKEQRRIAGEIFDHWLAVHDAEVRDGVVAEEPEIEWGLALTEDHNEVEFAFPSREDVADYYSGPVSDADPGEHLVTRRKAGPWMPVHD